MTMKTLSPTNNINQTPEQQRQNPQTHPMTKTQEQTPRTLQLLLNASMRTLENQQESAMQPQQNGFLTPHEIAFLRNGTMNPNTPLASSQSSLLVPNLRATPGQD